MLMFSFLLQPPMSAVDSPSMDSVPKVATARSGMFSNALNMQQKGNAQGTSVAFVTSIELGKSDDKLLNQVRMA